jgi:hypothetical protein
LYQLYVMTEALCCLIPCDLEEIRAFFMRKYTVITQFFVQAIQFYHK